jgi:hypothetical protein
VIDDPVQLLGEAKELATRMVDQIEWVDLYEEPLSQRMGEPVREGRQFTRDVTEWVKSPRTREQLKRIVVGLCQRIGADPWALKMMNPEEVCAAADLVTKAIRGLIRARETKNAWVLRRRLIVKFTSIESPWVQDPLANRVVSEAADAVESRR